MKRKLILLLALLAFSFWGCGEDKPKEEQPKSEKVESESAETLENAELEKEPSEELKNIELKDEEVLPIPVMCLAKSKYKEEEINGVDGVSLIANEAYYNVDLKGVIVTFSNASVTEYDFGQAYEIEKKLEDGWYSLAYAPTEYELAWQDICYILEPESDIEILIQTNLYGTYFGSGTYRIIKNIFPEGQPQNLYPISAEFVVSEE